MARVLITLLATGALAGCGIADPYVAPRPKVPHHRAPGPARVAESRHSPTVGRGAPTASAVARAFALAYTDWNWRALGASERRRRALAAGQLQSDLAHDAEAARENTTLGRDHMTSHGKVIAIARRGVVAYVIVRQSTMADGMAAIGDTTVVVYRALLRHRRTRWFVTAWSVES